MSGIFPNSRHKPHNLTFLALDCVVANCENNTPEQSLIKSVT